MNGSTRRRYLAGLGAAVTAGLAGCNAPGTGTDTNAGGEVGQIGSNREGRDIPGGTPMADLPDLSGELDLFSGRGQALVGNLIEFIGDRYPDLTIRPRYAGSTDLVNRILEEGDNSPADVFYSVNAGALGALAAEGRTMTLPDRVLDPVSEAFRDPDGNWVGTSGRARSIPYNTEQFSADEIPTDVFQFPELDRFDGAMGWTPAYGSFQAFITAMRIREGPERTKSWINGMQDSNVSTYGDEFTITQAVADGEIGAGFANVAGATTVDTAADPELANDFVRHLLSAEAQEYFATTTFEYPMISGVEPVQPGGTDLPTVDELNPPAELDLAQLAELKPTLELMRETGLSV
ncbi:iron ABC transporter substrate-binding protein [Halobacteriales archaeon QS_9_67_17]|nr:MAG: iron ABC transporter substrate-binding protein [Halobacteriales archaeon QS_9_67_17]